MMISREQEVLIQKISAANSGYVPDHVAVEEPLQIQLAYSTAHGRLQKNIAVTMRTPGHDEELAAGFLFTEGIIDNYETIRDIKHPAADDNRILVSLKENVLPVLTKSNRNFYTSSGCGICGKASIDAVRLNPVYQDVNDMISVTSALLLTLPAELGKEQQVFKNTGGIHAAAIFDLTGKLVNLREDVGRHNALDKLIGAMLLNKCLPVTDYILLLSGRASFELLQKAAMAGLKMVVAVGAPSSLAIEMAEDSNITLIGFMRNNGFNVYSGFQRIIHNDSSACGHVNEAMVHAEKCNDRS